MHTDNTDNMDASLNMPAQVGTRCSYIIITRLCFVTLLLYMYVHIRYLLNHMTVHVFL